MSLQFVVNITSSRDDMLLSKYPHQSSVVWKFLY